MLRRRLVLITKHYFALNNEGEYFKMQLFVGRLSAYGWVYNPHLPPFPRVCNMQHSSTLVNLVYLPREADFHAGAQSVCMYILN